MNSFKSKVGLPLGLIVLSIVTAFSAMTATAAASLTGSGDVESYIFGDSSNNQKFKVYVPQSYDGSTPVPMIMALHGCSMDNTDALNAWNLDLIADQHNVIVVFPYVGRFSEFRNADCWGYWFDKHVQEGRGGEVDYLYDLARVIESLYLIDTDRRFITGLSSGGGMAVAAAISYNDYWTAAAPVAGLAYGDWSDSVVSDQFRSLSYHIGAINDEHAFDGIDRAVPMLVVQSSNDTSVLPRAMELIRDSQLNVWADDSNADTTESCSKGGVSCTLTTYNGPDGTPIIKTMLYAGGPGRSASLGQGHYWPGGDDDLSVWSDGSNGPNAAEQMWAFFEEISGGGLSAAECENDSTAPATPTGLTSVDPHDNYAVLSVNANSESDLRGYKLYRTGGAELTPSPSTSTNIVVSGLITSTLYEVYATAVDLCGNESSGSSTVSFTTAPEDGGSSEEGTETDPDEPSDPVEPASWTRDGNLDGMEVYVYSPNSTTSNGKRALMIALHGCDQSNEIVRDSWGWTDEADQYGMVIAAPMAPNGGVLADCWDYYGTSHSASNPSGHDDNLVDLANSLMSNSSLNIDPDQVYIAGLSSGGGQTFLMGCLRPDIFAGIGINAGPALGTQYWEIGSVPFFTTSNGVASRCTGFSNRDADFNTQLTSVVHGRSDDLVSTGYAELDAAAMARVYGVSKDSGSYTVSGGGTEQTWSDNDGVRVSKIMVSGLGHAWPAGSGSGGGEYTNHGTIDYPAFLSKFLFDNNRRADFSGPTPTSTPGPTATPVPTPTPAPDCDDVTDYNHYHASSGRATISGSYWSRTYDAAGSGESMPGTAWSYTTLRSSNGSYWEVGSCP